jgi:hypothetical protein
VCRLKRVRETAWSPPLQLVPLSESSLSGAMVHIPKNVYDLEADWEIDPASLEIKEKIGKPPTRPTTLTLSIPQPSRAPGPTDWAALRVRRGARFFGGGA